MNEVLAAIDSSQPSNSTNKFESYRHSQLGHSIGQLLCSVVSLVALWVLMWMSLQYSYWLTLALSLPAAGFLVRLFIIQHDCSHGSFFASKTANEVVGCILGTLTLTPFYLWRRSHAIHHATSGDLDRRGYGDVWTMTVREYHEASAWERLCYRLYRSPWIFFSIASFVYFVILQRLTYWVPRTWKKEIASVYWTNATVLAYSMGLSWLIGVGPFLMIHVPIVALAASTGAWLFYVQHQFEETYWQHKERWDYFQAGVKGSSHYQLPKVLQWLTANIGLHHIHHIDSRIPNYRLQECADENPTFQNVTRIGLWESLSCVSLKLWDEREGRMVRFPSHGELHLRLQDDECQQTEQDGGIETAGNREEPAGGGVVGCRDAGQELG